MLRVMLVVSVIGVIALIVLVLGRSALERKLLFYPSHNPGGALPPWLDGNGNAIGVARLVASPKNVWLMLHGNGGQAADRVYALPSFSGEDAVFILEYPGYGLRAGAPSRESFNTAATDAFRRLQNTFPGVPVGVVGESIGTGPAGALAALENPPVKVVLIVPFATLAAVARDHFPSVMVGLILKSNWDNVSALAGYRGPVEIFGAKGDAIIPIAHARALAAGVPAAKLTLIDGGHNEWADAGRVRIRNP